MPSKSREVRIKETITELKVFNVCIGTQCGGYCRPCLPSQERLELKKQSQS